MKNHPKNHNPIQNRAPSQPEPVVQDTTPRLKFEVILSFTQSQWARVLIDAISPEEAEAQAEALLPEEIKVWNTISCEMCAESAELINGEENHE